MSGIKVLEIRNMRADNLPLLVKRIQEYCEKLPYMSAVRTADLANVLGVRPGHFSHTISHRSLAEYRAYSKTGNGFLWGSKETIRDGIKQKRLRKA